MWQKTWPGTKSDILSTNTIIATSGGFRNLGTTTDTDPWLDAYTFTVDGNGNATAETTFTRDGEDQAYDVRQASDGSYFVSGMTNGWRACEQPWVFHVSASGTQLGSFPAGPCTVEAPNDGHYDKRGYAWAVLPLGDGSVVIAGREYSATKLTEGFIAKVSNLDTTPTEAWHRTFGGAGEDSLLAIEQLPDGGFLAVGTTASFGAGGTDTYVVRTDADGIEEWHQTYGGAGNETGTSLLHGTDGSYLIAGTTTSSGAGGVDLDVIDIEGACSP